MEENELTLDQLTDIEYVEGSCDTFISMIVAHNPMNNRYLYAIASGNVIIKTEYFPSIDFSESLTASHIHINDLCYKVIKSFYDGFQYCVESFGL